MTTHLEQLYIILNALTSSNHTISYYPNRAVETAPSILIWPKSSNKGDVFIEEEYTLIVRASSLANLETSITEVCKFDSRYPITGYNKAALRWIKAGSIYTYIQDYGPLVDYSTDGIIGFRQVGAQEYYYQPILLFDLGIEVPFSGVILSLTPSATATIEAPSDPDYNILIWADGESHTITSAATAQTAASQIASPNEFETFAMLTWVDNTAATFTLSTTLLPNIDSPSRYISLYLQNLVDVATTDDDRIYFDAATVTLTVTTTGFPYHLEIEYNNQNFNENEFMAEFTMKARWAL